MLHNIWNYASIFIICYIYISCFVYFFKNYIDSKKSVIFDAEIIERIDHGHNKGLKVSYINSDGDELISKISYRGNRSIIPSKLKEGSKVKVYYSGNKELHLYEPGKQLFYILFFLVFSIIFVVLTIMFLTGCSAKDTKDFSYEQLGKEYVSEYLNQVYCEDTSYDFVVIKGKDDTGTEVDSTIVSSKYKVDNNIYTVYVNVDTMKVYNNYYKADIENAIKELLIAKISEQNLDIDLNGYNIEYLINLKCNSTKADNNNSSITVCLTDVYLSDITPVNVNDYMEDAFKSCFVKKIDESNFILNGKNECIRIYK